ncbi:MAG: hypothetical protein AABZ47_12975 [Planctomycetota bacterium]
MAASLVQAEVGYPSGIQDFESMAVGNGVLTLPSWVVVNTSANPADFTVVAADDFDSMIQPRGTSTRWLRVRDVDAANVQNRFYSPGIVAPSTLDYKWVFWVNLETIAPGGTATKPKLVIQHRDGANNYANAWGIEFTDTTANLAVLGIGGTPASTPLYTIASPNGLNDWVKLQLDVLFSEGIIEARFNNSSPVSLPINLNGNPQEFRFCYRGEGTGNVMTMLVDDVSVLVGNLPVKGPAVSFLGVAAMSILTVGVGAWVTRRRVSVCRPS